MMLVGFTIGALFLAAGFWLAWGIRDARQRDAEREARRLPPFISMELRDIEQRRAWRRLTPSEQRWVTDALFPALPRQAGGRR